MELFFVVVAAVVAASGLTDVGGVIVSAAVANGPTAGGIVFVVVAVMAVDTTTVGVANESANVSVAIDVFCFYGFGYQSVHFVFPGAKTYLTTYYFVCQRVFLFSHNKKMRKNVFPFTWEM